ncbi:hypothetical protein SAMN02982917_4027 [Azospirillum oryzae]|uniref:Uncharacterized protein n=1 Tax=Azospirillum oryzae TaxID=286727 RepID=A0A1X7GLJ2_9PROT|nr:hypothetical protein [Azospirillum oryzae]SMF71631.1 hypothetical protein SAMN02982917_4027 [Azospirillum oryzae]
MTASPPIPPALLRPILVRGLADALAAADAARSAGAALALMAPPAGGALWLLDLIERVRQAHPDLEVTGLLDCGDRAGEAQGALAAGVPALLFTGRPEAAERLSVIAAACGSVLLTACPPLLDLAAEGHGSTRSVLLEALCRDWLVSSNGRAESHAGG